MFETFKTAKRLTEHDDALLRVERRLAALEIQWGDTLDRLKTMMGRLLKERQRTERAAAEISPEDREGHLSDEDVSAGMNHVPGWSPRQQEAQQRILARRNRAGRGSEQ